MIRRVSIALAVAVVLTLMACAGWWIGRAIDPRWTAADQRAANIGAAQAASRYFLDAYVEQDGRVIRRDQGADVVSEGQAYAMLITAGIGNQKRFESVWSWTKTQLLRPDGVLSWRWAGGAVVDANSAADADIDAARALLIAGRRFQSAAFTADGNRLAAAVLNTETAAVGTAVAAPGGAVTPEGSGVAGTGRVLTAGNWASTAPYVVNPGYFSPRADADLFASSSDRRWNELTRTQRIIGWELIGSHLLPPDWARVDAAGGAAASGLVSGGDPQFGLDAARFPVRMAESCDPADRALAEALRPMLTRVTDSPGIRRLDGTPAAKWQHPIALVAQAAADKADGDDTSALHRLDDASAIQGRYPTYYGAAWVALGRIMLTTPLLGDCHPSAT